MCVSETCTCTVRPGKYPVELYVSSFPSFTLSPCRYKWGSVTHQSVGVVRSINRNGTDVCVDFPEQNNWTGLISEMEMVPGIHPRHRLVN